MIISCPSCTARFQVDSNAIGPDGRIVKCSQCAHVWQARAEDDEADSTAAAASAAETAAAVPEPAAEPAPPAQAEPARELETVVASAAEAPPPMPTAEETPPPPPPTAEEPPPPPPAPAQPRQPEGSPENVSSDGLDAAVEGLVGAIDEDAAELSEELAAAAPEPEEMQLEEPEGSDVPEPPAIPARDAAPPPPPPEPPPIPSRKDLARGSKGRIGRAVAWAFVILVVLVAGLGAGVHFARERLVELFPPLNIVLLQVGLGVPHLGEGLALASPVAELDDEGLRISGFIENKRGEILEIPLLRGALCDANSQEIYVWTFRAEDTRVLPGERISYETVVADAPTGAKDISIGFTTEAEIAAETAANGAGTIRTCN